jgi:hypothetical protein
LHEAVRRVDGGVEQVGCLRRCETDQVTGDEDRPLTGRQDLERGEQRNLQPRARRCAAFEPRAVLHGAKKGLLYQILGVGV